MTRASKPEPLARRIERALRQLWCRAFGHEDSGNGAVESDALLCRRCLAVTLQLEPPQREWAGYGAWLEELDRNLTRQLLELGPGESGRAAAERRPKPKPMAP